MLLKIRDEGKVVGIARKSGEWLSGSLAVIHLDFPDWSTNLACDKISHSYMYTFPNTQVRVIHGESE